MANLKAKCCTNHFQEEKYIMGLCLHLVASTKTLNDGTWIQSISRSSPPSWITWPMEVWLCCFRNHCFLHSINCSKSRHIFACFIFGPWLSRTAFCFSRSFYYKKKSGIIKSQLQGFTSVAIIRRIWYALNIWWVAVN